MENLGTVLGDTVVPFMEAFHFICSYVRGNRQHRKTEFLVCVICYIKKNKSGKELHCMYMGGWKWRPC